MHPALSYILVKQSIASNGALGKRPIWIIFLLALGVKQLFFFFLFAGGKGFWR